MSDALKNLRMQFATTPFALGIPAMVLGGAVVINLLIAAVVPGPGPHYTGASNAPIWYFLVLGILAINSYLPFALALGSTRQSFALGCLFMAGIGGLLLGVLMVMGGLLEQATDGFGFNAYMFYSPWVWDRGPLSAFLFFGLMTILIYSLGFLIGAVLKRFGMAVLVTGMIGVLAVLILVVWLAAEQWGWAAIGTWIAGLGGMQVATFAVPVILIVSLAGYRILLRLSVR